MNINFHIQTSRIYLMLTFLIIMLLSGGNLSCVSDVDPGQWVSGRIMRMNVKKWSVLL